MGETAGRKGASRPGAGLSLKLRAFLRRQGLQPRKGLGQHFLVDGRVLRRILAAAQLTPEDTVLEVGPGLGVLTRALARRVARVVAVELDPRLAQGLSRELASFPNVSIVEGDILTLSPSALVGGQAYKVVANIPYYITSPILRHFLEAEARPGLMVVMVQRQVGEAIVAPPGKSSLLSISVQLYSRPRLVGYVPPGSFYPPPKVESAILRLEVYPQPPVEVEAEGFFRMVAAGFAAPRKQLHNSLAQGLGISTEAAREALSRVEIAPQRRPATLTLEEWARLWLAFPLPQPSPVAVVGEGG